MVHTKQSGHIQYTHTQGEIEFIQMQINNGDKLGSVEGKRGKKYENK